MGDFEKSLADYRAAIALDDSNYYYLCNRALAYTCLQRYEDALKDFNRALQLTEDDALLFNDRGCLYLHMHDYEHAVADMNRAIQIDHAGKRQLGDQQEIQLGKIATDVMNTSSLNTEIDAADEPCDEMKSVEVADTETLKHLLYQNLKIALKLDNGLEYYLQFPLYQTYLGESPFKELVTEYTENKIQ
ncbi:tetratricopeptide repeat protein [Numidum massiliense]|uniref:tetratricopeptide repeat protein n=1 Tax=Numidum massiliense TaxID=1522315 RepID=UPI00164DEEAE|nr:tetratricopeptide repeat protein [Numidum massiliense]